LEEVHSEESTTSSNARRGGSAGQKRTAKKVVNHTGTARKGGDVAREQRGAIDWEQKKKKKKNKNMRKVSVPNHRPKR